MGLVDREAISAILEKMIEPLNSLGLEFDPRMTQLAITEDGVIALCHILIRDSAKNKLDDDAQARADFNKMMAEQNQAKLDEEKEAIRRELLGLEEDECSHTIIHPDGFCISCGKVQHA